ncbi:MAG: Ig-like domain-containing protein [Gemmatimonadaceae bacterium]|nr:Ig-like domain-containing protein [Gemmatimonadaceae bacterium]
MKRFAPFLAIGLAAGLSSCSKGGGSTGPKPVASVTVTAPGTGITVGQQVVLTYSVADATGAVLTGRAATWNSSNSLVATVTAAGTVTGVSPGVAIISATVEGKIGSVSITVAALQNPCAGAAGLALVPGDVRLLAGPDRSAICIAAGTTGSEYMLLAFNNSLDTTGQALGVRLDATNTTQAIGLPAAAALRLPTGPAPSLAAASSGPNRAFEVGLRTRERAELGPLLRARTDRAAAYERLQAQARARAPLRAPGAPSLVKGLSATPALGDLVTLNTNSKRACDTPEYNVGRVVAISSSSIILADTAAPAGGFTTADYQSFAATFDTLVFPLDTTAFGAPSDMDGNGRIVIFFTQAVNKLTAAGASSVIGGFFYARDLFPAAGNTALGLQACAASNEGEMFYAPVVDPNSVYNAYFKTKALLLTDVIGTLTHEFQHLINASRRMYVNDADDFEVVWLNEGLSHIAEELLFYRATGLAPKSDLTLAMIAASDPGFAMTNAYQVDNLSRYNSYLKAPESSSPYAKDDNLPTRGATWSFLRYAVDLGTLPSNSYFHALVNSKSNGMTNLSAVLGPVFTGGIATGFRSWALANFLGDAGVSANPLYQHASWNFRNILTNQLGNTGFPLQAKQIIGGASQSFTLPAGGAGYMRFRVNPGVQAAVVPSLLQPAVELVLVRTQ